MCASTTRPHFFFNEKKIAYPHILLIHVALLPKVEFQGKALEMEEDQLKMARMDQELKGRHGEDIIYFQGQGAMSGNSFSEHTIHV